MAETCWYNPDWKITIDRAGDIGQGKFYYKGEAVLSELVRTPEVAEEEQNSKICLVVDSWCDACQEYHTPKEAYDYTEKALDVTEEAHDYVQDFLEQNNGEYYYQGDEPVNRTDYTRMMKEMMGTSSLVNDKIVGTEAVITVLDDVDMVDHERKVFGRKLSGKEREEAAEIFLAGSDEVEEYQALDTQVGGDHYKGCAIQPVEYIAANDLNYFEGNIVKYITRHRRKGSGREDIEKVIHYAQLMLELEYGDK
jgi:hypothetical protein